MTAPMFHNLNAALAIVNRVIRAAGNRVDVSTLDRDDLYFLAGLPRSEDDRAFATSRICPRDQARLAELFDRCAVIAVIPSAIGKGVTGGGRNAAPTGEPTRAVHHA